MSHAAAPPELHLPDLPEVEVSLGAAPPRTHRALGAGARLRELVGAYLPLLLMLLLALGTWWLVKHTPRPSTDVEGTPLRHDPDYEMRNFAITRFAPDGRVTVRIEGTWLRHYPDTDRIEIEAARMQANAPDGRVTRASAARALSNGDGSEWQLSGDARVVAQLPSGPPLEVDSEFLQVYVPTERIRSHLPVIVRQGKDEIRAGGIDADNLAQQIQLAPPVRARLSPRAMQRLNGSRPAS
ncbi:MAG: LPS export ABC transporter periplasmic protein LptC [Ideonella sp.]|nr:MAG: LPS export ABC transporter periplasmic protein LptC [Burkholderiaceae bacterium]MBE7425593.1 LPS export ABC transporter periplasmic protein LptC [Ideonella sp.]